MQDRQDELMRLITEYGVLVMSIVKKMRSRVRVARWLSLEILAFMVAWSLTLITEVVEDGIGASLSILPPDGIWLFTVPRPSSVLALSFLSLSP